MLDMWTNSVFVYRHHVNLHVKQGFKPLRALTNGNICLALQIRLGY